MVVDGVEAEVDLSGGGGLTAVDGTELEGMGGPPLTESGYTLARGEALTGLV